MSLQTHKTDPELGRRVEAHLKLKGVNTPMVQGPEGVEGFTEAQQITLISNAFADIMDTMNLDLDDDSLIDTPARVGKMYIKELFWGLKPENFPKCTVVDNKMHYDEMVVEKNISTMSNCEHHFVTIDGKATVAYIPDGKVLGLSKINRIVEYFAKRPQIQERLTQQISEALKFILDTENVAVSIEAVHFCVKSRGVEDTGSSTVTNCLSGAFLNNPETRSEFFTIARS